MVTMCVSSPFSGKFAFFSCFIVAMTSKIKLKIAIKSMYISFYPHIIVISSLSCTVLKILPDKKILYSQGYRRSNVMEQIERLYACSYL